MSDPHVSVKTAIEEIASGRMVVVVDERHGAPAGIAMAAQLATADHVNFMAAHAKGLICLALTPERCEQLELDVLDADADAEPRASGFTPSLDAREVVDHGISSAGRARTIQRALHPDTRPEDLVQPGNVFPLKARPGGVLERPGRTESAVDLARLAGLAPAGVLCEILDEHGTVARGGALEAYCERHRLKLLSIADLVAYRRRRDRLIERIVETTMPTRFGDFRIVGYRSLLDGRHHVALVKGEVAGRDDVLASVHVECLTGHVFRSLRCDCAPRLEDALAQIGAAGRGVLAYVSREAPPLDPRHCDAPEEQLREAGIGGQILAELGLRSARLLTFSHDPHPEERRSDGRRSTRALRAAAGHPRVARP